MSYQFKITQKEYELFHDEVRLNLLLQYSCNLAEAEQCVEEHPSNTLDSDIRAKVKLLNSLYSTRVMVEPMVKNIIDVAANGDFETRLQKGDTKLVADIAQIAKRDNFSFATKYCALLAPDKYPIYDSLVWKFFCKLNDLGFFDEKTNKKFEKIKEFRSNAYSDYVEIYNEFMDKSDIRKFAKSYTDVDKFLWSAIKVYMLLKNSRVEKFLNQHLPNLLTSIIGSAIWHIISQIIFKI